MNEISFPGPAVGHRPADHPQVSCGAVGVLIVNLGTPDATDAKSVRRYLREFLHDKRVIEQDTHHMEIRPQRHHPAAAAGAQRPRLPENLEPREEQIAAEDDHALPGGKADRRACARMAVGSWSTGRCVTATPRSRCRLDALMSRGCDRILVVPLYPQYAAATSATVCDEAFRALMKMRWQPALRVAPPYFDDPATSMRWRPRSMRI